MATLKSPLSLLSPSTTRRIPTLELKTSSLNLRATNPLRPFRRTIEIRIPTRESCLGQSSFRFLGPWRSVQEMDVETATEDTLGELEQRDEKSRKLYVVNLPWSVTTDDLASLFGQCGTVEDVQVMRTRSGQSRGFGFVTMASVDDAQAVINKFNSFDLSGRMIRVEFAKKLVKPSDPPAVTPPPEPPIRETIHKLYISNLAWKARSMHIRDLFSEKFKPVSSRVVFEKPAGRSAGYGFVSFSTREEAEAALSEFNGRELMGRPLRLQFSVRSETPSEKEEEAITANSQQPETLSA